MCGSSEGFNLHKTCGVLFTRSKATKFLCLLHCNTKHRKFWHAKKQVLSVSSLVRNFCWKLGNVEKDKACSLEDVRCHCPFLLTCSVAGFQNYLPLCSPLRTLVLGAKQRAPDTWKLVCVEIWWLLSLRCRLEKKHVKTQSFVKQQTAFVTGKASRLFSFLASPTCWNDFSWGLIHTGRTAWIWTQTLWCCLCVVWTLPFTPTGSLCFASRCASCVDEAWRVKAAWANFTEFCVYIHSHWYFQALMSLLAKLHTCCMVAKC